MEKSSTACPQHGIGILILLTAALLAGTARAAAADLPGALTIAPGRVRASPGQTVEFVVAAPRETVVRAVLQTPSRGARDLPLVSDANGTWRARVAIRQDDPEGLYLVHAWTGDASRPRAVGKAALLAGRMVVDFWLPRYVDSSRPHEDLAGYLDEFAGIGGNALIAHALITPDRAYFPSTIARTTLTPGHSGDLVDRVLTEADRRGLAVFLSVSWDMTRRAPYAGRMEEIGALMRELYTLYARHPSLAGFYSYQEGSGTYYVPYVREFTARVKQMSPGLLTAVAPFLDDPLLAGYLATVDSLDVVIYQGMVMASYRPDNRKLFPARRVRDFAALGIGAKWLQDKFAIVHVEVFAYAEKRIAPDVIAGAPEDIYAQLLGVATAAGSDGLALFAYHPHLYAARGDARVAPSRRAAAEGVAMFRRIAAVSGSGPLPLAVYVPYSDWIVERWTASLIPGLDALRAAAVPVDILPYAPPLEESHYPYFPFHHNPDVLARLLAERQVLLLPDVSGFQQTDSDLIDAYVKAGGIVVAFGPQIPYGRSYDRDTLFGGRETGTRTPASIRARAPLGDRLAAAHARRLAAAAPLPIWTAGTATVLAEFDDGSPAVLANAYGKGLAIAVLPPAPQLSSAFPELLRGVIDVALAHGGHPPLADITGLSVESDLAVAGRPGSRTVALVNYGEQPLVVSVGIDPGAVWVDAFTRQALAQDGPDRVSLDLPPARERVITQVPKRERRP